ncbi:MAG: acyltransferase family protein [Rubrivivax sp.]|nr:acyltransferase family protein [Rubrivivax sp.]
MTTSRIPTRALAAPAEVPIRPREYFIDWLRILALGLLMVYHVGMAYVGWTWHVKSAWSATMATAVEPWMRLAAPWRMTLLFVVSGMALSLMLQRRAAEAAAGSGGGWLRQRARRLLLPLLTGVVLVVPVQSYFEVRQFHGYAGSFAEFLQLYFTGHGGFCNAARGCLILPTWNHLWFLPYLLVYTAVLAGVLWRWPQALDPAAAALVRAMAGWRLVAGPIAWLVLTRLVLAPLFGQTHALVDDWFAHAQYAAALALGVLLVRPAAAALLLPRFSQLRWLALALGLLCWALLVATQAGPAWRALPWSVMQWCGVVAAIGFARLHLGRDHAWRRYLSGAVFPVYLVHQTVTVAAVALLAPLRLGFAAEAALLLGLTFTAGIVAYEGVRRVPRLGEWFGVAEPQRVPPAPAGGRAYRHGRSHGNAGA